LLHCTSYEREASENSESRIESKASNRQVDRGHETAAERILTESDLQQHWIKRLIAILIDSFIVGIATTILSLISDASGIFNWMRLPFVMGLLYVFYFTITEFTYGYTLGKRIVNLKVMQTSGERPSLKNAFLRNISKIHFLILLLDTLGGFFASKDNHQRYIDQISNTTVA
jgi:uncharacterized RDD family membrane protein YckC